MLIYKSISPLQIVPFWYTSAIPVSEKKQSDIPVYKPKETENEKPTMLPTLVPYTTLPSGVASSSEVPDYQGLDRTEFENVEVVLEELQRKSAEAAGITVSACFFFIIFFLKIQMYNFYQFCITERVWDDINLRYDWYWWDSSLQPSAYEIACSNTVLWSLSTLPHN